MKLRYTRMDLFETLIQSLRECSLLLNPYGNRYTPKVAFSFISDNIVNSVTQHITSLLH